MTGSMLVPAAQYLRMSTEHQQYSPENQAQSIREYAEAHGFVIVCSYFDPAKSGILLKNRFGLRGLIRDVTAGPTAYKAILVYDISRWGRFQDIDESAHYEFLCKSAGIPVHYCAEQFANDGSLPSSIMKALKRAMAGEYSRELGVKVFAGQKRLAQLGFKLGGVPGYGLRRMLVSEDRRPKQLLTAGQRKNIATDRVILALGPAQEVECVRMIYRMFTQNRLSVAEITRELNRRRIRYCNDKEWSHSNVLTILTHAKYVGSVVFNRASSRLGARKVRHPRPDWIVTPRAWEGIVDEATFAEAQRVFANLTIHLSDEQMLERLRVVLASEGKLSTEIIDRSRDVPCAAAYRHRFGSMLRAYELIGYTGHTVAAPNTSRRIHALRNDLLGRICEMFPDHVRIVRPDNKRRICLWMKSGFMVSLLISRFRRWDRRWQVRPVAKERGLVTLLARLDRQNQSFLDFHVFQRIVHDKDFYLDLESDRLRQAVHLPDLSDFCRITHELYAQRKQERAA